MAKVLIVDDSATMRSLVANALKRDPDIEVVGAVGDPLAAREAIKELNPDVVTLDIEMPKMDGLSFLDKIMRLRPMPVIMISTLTQRGAEASIRALELGAFDCVGKPGPGVAALDAFSGLPAIVKAASRSRTRVRSDAPRKVATAPENFHANGRVVCIGSSTGGVEALLDVLSVFPKNCPPTLIVQHMPENFTRSFAARLNQACAAEVAEAYEGAPLKEGQIWLAPGGVAHLEIASPGRNPRCRIVPGEAVSGHKPSVDVLFRSAVPFGANAIGAILTGMGRDGASGLLAMRQAGASTIGQNEATSLIYGMPKAAQELGAVETQLPLHTIGEGILARCRPHTRSVTACHRHA